jgi:hypothetical protein
MRSSPFQPERIRGRSAPSSCGGGVGADSCVRPRRDPSSASRADTPESAPTAPTDVGFVREPLQADTRAGRVLGVEAAVAGSTGPDRAWIRGDKRTRSVVTLSRARAATSDGRLVRSTDTGATGDPHWWSPGTPHPVRCGVRRPSRHGASTGGPMTGLRWRAHPSANSFLLPPRASPGRLARPGEVAFPRLVGEELVTGAGSRVLVGPRAAVEAVALYCRQSSRGRLPRRDGRLRHPGAPSACRTT